MNKIIGYAEGFTKGNLVGWAVAPGSNQNCLIEIFNDLGEKVGAGRASRSRDDLKVLNLGRANLGFSIPIKRQLGSGLLHILANKVELSGSPIRYGVGLFDGEFKVLQGVVHGIIAERSRSPDTSILITIKSQDGIVVGQSFAGPENYQSDDAFQGWREFKFPLENSCFGREELYLTAYANGVRFSQLSLPLRLAGHIDVLSLEKIEGWLCCPDAPLHKLVLDLWINDIKVAKGICRLPREDVRELYPQCPKAGFQIVNKSFASDRAELSKISVRLENSELEQFGGPFLIGGKFARIDSAKRVTNIIRGLDGKLESNDKGLLLDVVGSFLKLTRQQEAVTRIRAERSASLLRDVMRPSRRLNIVIPIYKGVAETFACIESVIANYGSMDSLILIADCPPEPEMTSMLSRFKGLENIYILENRINLGFVGTVNRGLAFCGVGDVLLLNSDTKLFPGALNELYSVLHSSSEIGTVTAISNNATIFSYPHQKLPAKNLEDITWEEIAKTAMEASSGKVIDVPTGHGFCMLIRRELLDQLPRLSEDYGRGYGEENEFCARASDMGYRHVAAPAVFVEHVEGVSFGEEKNRLVLENLKKLAVSYPDYSSMIMSYERKDGLRSARWPLDRLRLKSECTRGTKFALVIENWFDGGTAKAVSDIDELIGYQGRKKLKLLATEGGGVELTSDGLRLVSVYLQSDIDELFVTLSLLDISLVVIHQLLGFNASFIIYLTKWIRNRNGIFFIHDFYALCPRVNLINAVEAYCGVADHETCRRCVEISGAHAASQMNSINPSDHRELFQRLFDSMSHIIVPSESAAFLFKRVFKSNRITVLPHPSKKKYIETSSRVRKVNHVALLGAIGPHKGSQILFDLALRAQLYFPQIRFYVIGFTDIDEQLENLPNVVVTGRYAKGDLARLIVESEAAVALFLHRWPETFSYTFSEAIEHGLVPVVPDIGAPAERSRKSGIGVIYPFPIDVASVLEALSSLLNTHKIHEKIDLDSHFESVNSISDLSKLFSESMVMSSDDQVQKEAFVNLDSKQSKISSSSSRKSTKTKSGR